MTSLFTLGVSAQKHDDHPNGHHKNHRFTNAEEWASRFEAADRAKWQRPDWIISRLGLRKDMIVADIGSATGYFPIRIAPHVKSVIGVDIEPSMVAYLKKRAADEGVHNLTSQVGSSTSPLLKTPVDTILMVDTFHHIEKRVAYFSALKDALRPGGTLAIVDFKKFKTPHGPGPAMRLAPQTIIDEMKRAGFSLLELDETHLPEQYLLRFTVSHGK